MKINQEIIKKSINHYGEDMQSLVCMEEPSELIQAISKVKRYGNIGEYRDGLIEEMADVLICISLLQQIYGVSDDDLQDMIAYKQVRNIMEDDK